MAGTSSRAWAEGIQRAVAAVALAVAIAGPASASLIDALPTPPPSVAHLKRYMVPVSGAFVFYEDFEHGVKRWAIRGNARSLGWHLLEAHSCGGAFVMHLGGPVEKPFTRGQADCLLTLKGPLDLRKTRHPFLKYDVKGSCDPPGAASYQAEIRRPGGRWQPVGPRIDGRFNLMRSIYIDLAGFAGSRPDLRFHGRLVPSARPTLGLYLDDIQIVERSGP